MCGLHTTGARGFQWARAIALYLQRHLSDSLPVQVANIISAGGVQGGNVFAFRRKQGSDDVVSHGGFSLSLAVPGYLTFSR